MRTFFLTIIHFCKIHIVQYICERTQTFLKERKSNTFVSERKSFARERKRFASECKFSRGKAIHLQENAKYLWGITRVSPWNTTPFWEKATFLWANAKKKCLQSSYPFRCSIALWLDKMINVLIHVVEKINTVLSVKNRSK